MFEEKLHNCYFYDQSNTEKGSDLSYELFQKLLNYAYPMAYDD